MKDLAFYPGCSLKTINRDYSESIYPVAGALGLKLTEIDEWTCCGATAAHSLDSRMSVLLPARNIAVAERMGLDIAAACPMCLKRLKLTKHLFRMRQVDDPWSLELRLEINDLARLIASEDYLQRVRENVRSPLEGLKVVCFYGCQVVRPPKITGYKDYENPTHLDRLVETLGATSIDWSYKSTCCSAATGIPRKDIGQALIKRLIAWAKRSGADAMVVCCPLCQSNLDLHQPELKKKLGWDFELPVFYYTELMGLAFGMKDVLSTLQYHLVDPTPLVENLLDR